MGELGEHPETLPWVMKLPIRPEMPPHMYHMTGMMVMRPMLSEDLTEEWKTVTWG